MCILILASLTLTEAHRSKIKQDGATIYLTLPPAPSWIDGPSSSDGLRHKRSRSREPKTLCRPIVSIYAILVIKKVGRGGE